MCCQVAKVDGEDTDDAKARKKLQKHLKRQKNNSAASSLQAWGACIQRLPVDTEGSRKRSRQEKHFFAEASKTATPKISKMEGGWVEKGAAPKKTKARKTELKRGWLRPRSFSSFPVVFVSFASSFLPSCLPCLFSSLSSFFSSRFSRLLVCFFLPHFFYFYYSDYYYTMKLLLHYDATTMLLLCCYYFFADTCATLRLFFFPFPHSFPLIPFPPFLRSFFFSFPSFHFFPSLLPSVLSSFLAPFLPSLPIFLPAFLPYSFFILFWCKRCGWSSKMVFDTYPRNGSVQNYVSKFLNWINSSDDIIYKN